MSTRISTRPVSQDICSLPIVAARVLLCCWRLPPSARTRTHRFRCASAASLGAAGASLASASTHTASMVLASGLLQRPACQLDSAPGQRLPDRPRGRTPRAGFPGGFPWLCITGARPTARPARRYRFFRAFSDTRRACRRPPLGPGKDRPPVGHWETRGPNHGTNWLLSFARFPGHRPAACTLHVRSATRNGRPGAGRARRWSDRGQRRGLQRGPSGTRLAERSGRTVPDRQLPGGRQLRRVPSRHASGHRAHVRRQDAVQGAAQRASGQNDSPAAARSRAARAAGGLRARRAAGGQVRVPRRRLLRARALPRRRSAGAAAGARRDCQSGPSRAGTPAAAHRAGRSRRTGAGRSRDHGATGKRHGRRGDFSLRGVDRSLVVRPADSHVRHKTPCRSAARSTRP